MSYIDTGESHETRFLETRLLNRMDRKRGDVFLRADFGDLGGYDQVGRVLRELVRKGRLVKVGQGLYARAGASMTSGEPVPVGGLSALKEALRRVGVETLPSRIEQDSMQDAPRRCRPAAWSG